MTLLSRGVSLNAVRLADQISEHRAFAADVTAYAPREGAVLGDLVGKTDSVEADAAG